ncbi:unnamed protein product [Rhizophagus irregularis]|nr:unnamed protein product [Rhizophagus irregularis]
MSMNFKYFHSFSYSLDDSIIHTKRLVFIIGAKNSKKYKDRKIGISLNIEFVKGADSKIVFWGIYFVF